MRLYNNLVQRCFGDCVDDFRSKHLTDGEEKVCMFSRGCNVADLCLLTLAVAEAADSNHLTDGEEKVRLCGRRIIMGFQSC